VRPNAHGTIEAAFDGRLRQNFVKPLPSAGVMTGTAPGPTTLSETAFVARLRGSAPGARLFVPPFRAGPQ
jgi:hypothetical protein